MHHSLSSVARTKPFIGSMIFALSICLGVNFFITQASLGEPRAEVVKTLLLELNDEVKGTAVDENPMELISRSPEFFSAFSCVVATDLPEPALLKLASLLWEKKIPLCVARAYGMTGMWRNVLPEVCIIESRPEYAKENYRIASTFPQLEAFAAQYDLDTCKHPHLPLTEVPAVEAMELLLSKMRKTPDNIAFLMALDLK